VAGKTSIKFVEMEIGMNKKLLALAVAAAVSTPAVALADDSTVTLYGTLFIDFENVKADGGPSGTAGVPSRNRVSSNSSNIGIRGVEPLGGGLNAWFQVENGAAIDDGSAGASSGTWASRNSGVGLNGGFGSFLLGKWDTPYKFSTGRLDPFGNTSIAAYTGILAGDTTSSFGNAAGRNSFDRRQTNSVQYWTPNLSGFSARLGYGANEEKTAVAPASNPKLYSLSASYENGPIYVTAAYEKHDEYANTLTNKTDDKGWKVGGGYTFLGAHTIGLVYEELKYEGNLAQLVTTGGLPKASVTTTAIVNNPNGEAKLKTYFVSYLGKFGPHNVLVSYGQNRKLKVAGSEIDNTDARLYNIGYGYNLSKRTELRAWYTKIDNKDASRNTFAVNGLTGVANGQDPRGFAVGIKHTF
jgi:predicted porin